MAASTISRQSGGTAAHHSFRGLFAGILDRRHNRRAHYPARAKHNSLRHLPHFDHAIQEPAHSALTDWSELNVDAVVESSLQRTGDHFKISAHLIDVKTDTHLWEQDYEADMSELPRYASRIALDIAASLRQSVPVRLGHASGPVVSGEAFDLYLKGQFLWNHSQTEAALRHFQRAVALQPNYAAAYAGIAKSYCRLEVEQVLPPSEAFPPASAAVERALDLDLHNSDAHAARSFICAQRDWNWNRAEEELRIAIARDPSNSMGHRWYRYILHHKGRNEEALEQARLAVKADPVSVLLITQYAIELARNKHYTEAIANYLEAAEFAPNEDDIGTASRTRTKRRANSIRPPMSWRRPTHSREKQTLQISFVGLICEAVMRKPRTPHEARTSGANSCFSRRSRRGRNTYRLPLSSMPTLDCETKRIRSAWLESAYATDSHVMVELRDERFDFVRQEPRFKRIWTMSPFLIDLHSNTRERIVCHSGFAFRHRSACEDLLPSDGILPSDVALSPTHSL